MKHILKLKHIFWEDIKNGNKNFEVRNCTDRCFNKGDTIQFQLSYDEYSYNEDAEEELFEITYVLSSWGIKEGYVAFGIKEIKDE